MFSLRFRDVLPTVVLDELESLVNQLKGFLSISFNEDGTLIGSNPMLNVVQVGALNGWLTGTPPEGWLLLDGSQKNRVTYKSLFELWGTDFGAGDGSTTFTLPDMRGRFFLGKAAAGTGAVLGETGGTIDHTHSVPGLSFSDTSSSDGAHTHSVTTAVTITGPTEVQSGTGTNVASILHIHNGTAASDGSHTHDVAGTTGTGTSGTNNPPYFAGNWIVFAGV